MKILLATAPWSFADVSPRHLHDSTGLLGRILGIGARTVKGASPPMGLLYIASMLRQHGHDVVLADGSDLSLGGIIELIRASEAEVIGISAMTPLWPRSQRLAREIKQRFDLPIVVGGPFPTVWRERCLEECDAIDYAVAGEAEHIMVELIDAIAGRREVSTVKGVAWRDGARSVMNPAAKVPKDLDALPFPARDLVDVTRYTPTLVRYKRLPTTQFFSTRGCPFGCHFCWVNPIYRKRSIDNIMAEIDECVSRWGIRDITFFDDDSTIDLSHTEAIADAILESGHDITWAINARVDGGLTGPLLKKMKRAGLWRILYGIESGVQNNLDTMRKRTKVAQIREAVTMTRRAGISPYGTFIFGTPGETFEDGLETIKFACSLDLEFASFTALTPFPGTAFFDQIDKSRMYDWDRFTGDKPSFEPDAMTPEQLQTLMGLAYKKFYFRPRYILRRLAGCTSMEEIRRNVAGFEGLRKVTAEPDSPEAAYQAPERAGAVGCGVVGPDELPATARGGRNGNGTG